MNCKNCNEPLPPIATFCTNCGIQDPFTSTDQETELRKNSASNKVKKTIQQKLIPFLIGTIIIMIGLISYLIFFY